MTGVRDWLWRPYTIPRWVLAWALLVLATLAMMVGTPHQAQSSDFVVIPAGGSSPGPAKPK
jgi:hypothetical protein